MNAFFFHCIKIISSQWESYEVLIYVLIVNSDIWNNWFTYPLLEMRSSFYDRIILYCGSLSNPYQQDWVVLNHGWRELVGMQENVISNLFPKALCYWDDIKKKKTPISCIYYLIAEWKWTFNFVGCLKIGDTLHQCVPCWLDLCLFCDGASLKLERRLL